MISFVQGMHGAQPSPARLGSEWRGSPRLGPTRPDPVRMIPLCRACTGFDAQPPHCLVREAAREEDARIASCDGDGCLF